MASRLTLSVFQLRLDGSTPGGGGDVDAAEGLEFGEPALGMGDAVPFVLEGVPVGDERPDAIDFWSSIFLRHDPMISDASRGIDGSISFCPFTLLTIFPILVARNSSSDGLTLIFKSFSRPSITDVGSRAEMAFVSAAPFACTSRLSRLDMVGVLLRGLSGRFAGLTVPIN